MNRQEFAWLIVRALGVIGLWNFAVSILSLTVMIPSLYFGFHPSSSALGSLVQEQSLHQLMISGSSRIAGAVFWALLSLYLLYKGHLVHRLLLENIPNA